MSSDSDLETGAGFSSVFAPSVLVPVSEYGEFFAMLSIAEDVQGELGLHPVFVFVSDYTKSLEHGRLVESKHWSWVKLGSKRRSFVLPSDLSSKKGYQRAERPPDSDLAPNISINSHADEATDPPTASSSPVLWFHDLFRTGARILRMRRLAGQLPPDDPPAGSIQSFQVEKYVSHQLEHAREIVEELDPRLVISGQDFAGSVTSFIAKAAEEKAVKTAIVPYSMPPTTKEIIESFAYLGTNKLEAWQSRILSKNLAHWINTRRGVDYSRQPLRAAIALEKYDVAPPQPWTPNSGRGVILAPSKSGMDYYLESGIPEEKLRLTGAPWSDYLVKIQPSRKSRRATLTDNVKATLNSRKRKNPVAASRLADTQNLVIVSWPPNQYPRKAVGAETYSDLCDQFIQSLAGLQEAGLAHVLVSLHPTLSDEKLRKDIKQAGLYLLSERLMDVVDCADIFCSTVSSTSFWALQCGMPTINYDGFLYGYTEFEEAGAITVDSAAGMQKVMQELLSKKTAYKNARDRILAVKDEWCIDDGKCKDRIMAELRTLATLKA